MTNSITISVEKNKDWQLSKRSCLIFIMSKHGRRSCVRWSWECSSIKCYVMMNYSWLIKERRGGEKRRGEGKRREEEKRGREERRGFWSLYYIDPPYGIIKNHLRAGLRITFSHSQCQKYKQLSPEWALLAERAALPFTTHPISGFSLWL